MALSKVPVVAGTKTLARGSVVIGNASGEPSALAIGSNTYVLKSDGTDISWGADQAGTITAFTNGVDNRVVTATSATALNGEANLTHDGTTTTIKATAGAATTETAVITTANNANPAYANLVFKSGGNTSGAWIKGVQASGGNDGRLEFHTNNSGTVGEAMRMMYNGNWIQGTASSGSDGRQYTFGSSISSYRAGTADAYHMVFFNANGEIGRIRTSGSSTAYNTSSDYRLKENEVAISDGIARLKQLKPYRFNFKTDADTTVDGFFAHEVTPVVPEAISGDKDAMHPEVLYTDKDELPEGKEIGDVKEATKINPQAIDQSKLVPLLTSALQEAITKIETLEAKVAALEAD
jgi:hypothetical protein